MEWPIKCGAIIYWSGYCQPPPPLPATQSVLFIIYLWNDKTSGHTQMFGTSSYVCGLNLLRRIAVVLTQSSRSDLDRGGPDRWRIREVFHTRPSPVYSLYYEIHDKLLITLIMSREIWRDRPSWYGLRGWKNNVNDIFMYQNLTCKLRDYFIISWLEIGVI